GADGNVARKDVTTARAEAGNWIVTDGLAAGDQVVVSGLQRARVGEPATAAPWQPTAAPGAQGAAGGQGAAAGAGAEGAAPGATDAAGQGAPDPDAAVPAAAAGEAGSDDAGDAGGTGGAAAGTGNQD